MKNTTFVVITLAILLYILMIVAWEFGKVVAIWKWIAS